MKQAIFIFYSIAMHKLWKSSVMPHKLLNVADLLEYLPLLREDIDTLVRRHEIPFELIGGRPMFRRKDIDAWASQRILGFANKPLRGYHQRSSVKAYDLSHRHAIIGKLLRNQCVTSDLEGRTKPAVLRAMVKLAEHSEIGHDPDDLLQSLRAREELCSTALPGGIALLHPRHHEPYMFEDSFLAFGRVPSPVPFGAADGELTDLFFLICCQDDRIHLHVLARLCLMASRTSLMENLRKAPEAADIILAIQNSENEVIRSLDGNPKPEEAPDA